MLLQQAEKREKAVQHARFLLDQLLAKALADPAAGTDDGHLRCKDGSLDMRRKENRGKQKWAHLAVPAKDLVQDILAI